MPGGIGNGASPTVRTCPRTSTLSAICITWKCRDGDISEHMGKGLAVLVRAIEGQGQGDLLHCGSNLRLRVWTVLGGSGFGQCGECFLEVGDCFRLREGGT